MQQLQEAKLIIQNLNIIEQAHRLIIDKVQPKVFKAIAQLTQDQVESWNVATEGQYEYEDDIDIWFLDQAWKESALDTDNTINSSNLYAYYKLLVFWKSENDEIGNEHWLTSLFENNFEYMGFQFVIDSKQLAERPKKKDWNNFLLQWNQRIPELEKLGFKYDHTDMMWYLPIESLNAEEVANNYESDTIVDALQPIENAMSILNQARPYFTQILNDGLQIFGRVDLES